MTEQIILPILLIFIELLISVYRDFTVPVIYSKSFKLLSYRTIKKMSEKKKQSTEKPFFFLYRAYGTVKSIHIYICKLLINWHLTEGVNLFWECRNATDYEVYLVCLSTYVVCLLLFPFL